MPDRFVVVLRKIWILALLIGIGGPANAGFGEPGTVWNPITATQAMDSRRGQCPLFPEEWRSGSTLDLEIPEIKLTFGRGGVAMKIDSRRFVGRTITEFWAGRPYDYKEEFPPNMTEVFEYCQKLYGIDNMEAWSKALGTPNTTRLMPGFVFGTFTLIGTGLASSNTEDGRVVAGVAGIGVFTSLTANWVGRRIAGRQVRNSEAPNLIRQLFVKAQAQEQRAEDLAVKCVKGFDKLTPQSAGSILRKREKDCKKAIDAFAPQTHGWQTSSVLHRLKNNQLALNNLIHDHETLVFSRACELTGKTSRTKLQSYDAFKLNKSLLECEYLSELLIEAKGSELEGHYEALGVMSASRTQAIIKRVKKAEKTRERRETAKQRAETARQKKAAQALIQKFFEAGSSSGSSSSGNATPACTYKKLMSISRGWPRVHTEYGGYRGKEIKSVTFRVTDHTQREAVEKIGCEYDPNGRIPGERVEVGKRYFKVNF